MAPLVVRLATARTAGRPGTGARSGRRCGGCHRDGQAPGRPPRPAPRGSPGPGSWAASTSRWRHGAGRPSMTTALHVGSDRAAPRPGRHGRGMSRRHDRPALDPIRCGSTAALPSGAARGPCCTPRTASVRRTAAHRSRHADSRRCARRERDRDCGRSRPADRTGATRGARPPCAPKQARPAGNAVARAGAERRGTDARSRGRC